MRHNFTGDTNKHNLCYWATENPHKLHECLLYNQKVTIWCAVSSAVTAGPISFKMNVGKWSKLLCIIPVMIKTFFMLRVQNFPSHEKSMFQQDCAMAHTVRNSKAALHNVLPQWMIFCSDDLTKPTYSSNMFSTISLRIHKRQFVTVGQ